MDLGYRNLGDMKDHSIACQSHAMQCALENSRDAALDTPNDYQEHNFYLLLTVLAEHAATYYNGLLSPFPDCVECEINSKPIPYTVTPQDTCKCKHGYLDQHDVFNHMKFGNECTND